MAYRPSLVRAVSLLVPVVLLVLAGCSSEPAEDPEGSAPSTPPSFAAAQDPLVAAFRAVRNASARSSLFDVSKSGGGVDVGDDVDDLNARAGLSESSPPHWVEPPDGVLACFVTGDAWVAVATPGGAGRSTVALGEGSSCPAAGPEPGTPFPDAEVLGRRPRGDEGPGRWLRGGDRLEPLVPADLSDTWSEEFDLGVTQGQEEAIDLARLLFSSLEVFAANNPGRPLPRPEELGDYEPWGFEVAEADRIRDYEIDGTAVRFCASGPDGSWALVSRQDDVIATGADGEECTES